MIFLNPSFEDSNGGGDKWSYLNALSASENIVQSDSGVTPQDESYFLKMTAGTAGIGIMQNVFLAYYNQRAPYISFFYRKTATSAGSKLKLTMDGNDLYVIESTSAVNGWTEVRINLLDYSSEEGIEHIFKFVTEGTSSGTYYLDNIQILYHDCNPACYYGICYLENGVTEKCQCDFNHDGELCQYPRCGDGRIMFPETCDDGNAENGDGCSSTCKVETGWECPTAGAPCKDICGDGKTMSSAPNACDDGNTQDGDGCSHECKWETHFKCTQSQTTRSVCSIWCGDGLVYPPEVCDVAAGGSGAGGCSSDCAEVNDGWECSIYPDMPNSCFQHVCGDGARTSEEECDDGNTVSGDGCSSSCTIEPGFIITLESR